MPITLEFLVIFHDPQLYPIDRIITINADVAKTYFSDLFYLFSGDQLETTTYR